jgi:DNA primase
MTKNWVDFKEIKATVSMEMLLRHYELFEKLKPSGGNLVGCCSIHKGSNPDLSPENRST